MAIADPQKSLMLIIGATLLAGFSLASIMAYTDPQTAGWTIFVFFYASAFLTGLGIFSLLGLAVRRFWFKGLFTKNLGSSLRQGLLLSIIFVLFLALSAQGLLYWWVALSVILPLAAIEGFINLKI